MQMSSGLRFTNHRDPDTSTEYGDPMSRRLVSFAGFSMAHTTKL